MLIHSMCIMHQCNWSSLCLHVAIILSTTGMIVSLLILSYYTALALKNLVTVHTCMVHVCIGHTCLSFNPTGAIPWYGARVHYLFARSYDCIHSAIKLYTRKGRWG